MRLLLINPCNPLVSLANRKASRWNRYRVWKPLGLLVLAGLTPPDWQVTIADENLHVPDYDAMPRPDLVGITAFTSQASRAYEIAAGFRGRGVPVVMGGIHATMRREEAADHVDSVVTGEAEGVWSAVLTDVSTGRLQPLYAGGLADMAQAPVPRHDLLNDGYAFGSVQTTRGCPLSCEFCSVSAFNGRAYRQRPIDDVIAELRAIREKWVLVVDDNLIGTSRAHVDRAKELFRAMIRADLGKKWIAQATINMADDDELLSLASQAGCHGVFIGFESVSADGLAEVGKKLNLHRKRDMRSSVAQIQRNGMLVVGSFILGLDSDRPGIGQQVADTARQYGVDILNSLFLTPLPGTRLWDRLAAENRIAADDFPDDWQYYTLSFPTARYRHFSWTQIVREMRTCDRRFYSWRQILRRVGRGLLRRTHPLLSLVTNLSYRNNAALSHGVYAQMGLLDARTGSRWTAAARDALAGWAAKPRRDGAV